MSVINTELELTCIKEDASFLKELVLKLRKHESSSILSFNIFPYLSLFTWESYQYFQKNFSSYSLSLDSKYESIIKTSRLRIKFFEDKKIQAEGVFDLLDWAISFHKSVHIDQHTGIFAPLKRFLQDDLGIFLYAEKIIGSTHTGLLNVGVGSINFPQEKTEMLKSLGPLMFSTSKQIGEYMGSVLLIPEIQQIKEMNPHFSYSLLDEQLQYVDVKSKKFLPAIFEGSEKEAINLLLLMLLTQINFILFILPQLMGSSKYTLFKQKYIVLYQTQSSLMRLQNYGYGKGVLTERSKDFLQRILKNKNLSWLTKRKKFRNILVHYSIKGIPEKEIDLTKDLFGLSEYFFEGLDFINLSEKVDFELERISNLLEEWLSWKPRPHQLRDW